MRREGGGLKGAAKKTFSIRLNGEYLKPHAFWPLTKLIMDYKRAKSRNELCVFLLLRPTGAIYKAV